MATKGKYEYEYPRPMVTVDCIVYYIIENDPYLLLIERKHEPYQNMWALPGGFVDMDEDLQQAAQRELFEETNLNCEQLIQFKTYGTPGRDPRGRTISVIFFQQIQAADSGVCAGDDAAQAQWFQVKNLPQLAFDHGKIVRDFFLQY